MRVDVQHSESPPTAVRSVGRAVDILHALAVAKGPMTLSQLSDAIHAPRSTTLLIARTLAARRILDFDRERKSYGLGLALAELGARVHEGLELRTIAKPYLERLADRTRETVYLSVVDGDEVLLIEKIDSRQPLRYNAQVGTRRPLHSTSPGKLALAMMPESHVEAYIQRSGLPRFTERTLTDPDRLRREIARIRRRGYSLSDGEMIADLMGIAAPIVGAAGEYVGAVNVSGPATRLRKSQHDLVEATRDIAGAISRDCVRFGQARRP
jgi:DNA-binding IclR family transcriptional regulator